MANLYATLLAAYVMGYADQALDKLEHRKSTYGAFEAFKADTPNTIKAEMLAAAKKSAIRSTSIPVIKNKSYSISTTRSCSIITNLNESALVTVTFATVRAGFDMYPAEYNGNVVAYADDLKIKMDDMQTSILKNLDSACVTKLNAVKSAVNNADGNPWTAVGNVAEVPKADHEMFFNELDAIMAANDLNGNLNVVASPRMMALVKYLQNQGAGNDKNTAFQFSGHKIGYSNRVVVDADYRDVAYVFPNGTLGFIPWIDVDAQKGHKSGDGKEWSVQPMPLLGLDMGLLYQSTCADGSSPAHAGLEATLHEGFTFSFDYALVSAYNSDTSTLPGSVFKFGLLKA